MANAKIEEELKAATAEVEAAKRKFDLINKMTKLTQIKKASVVEPPKERYNLFDMLDRDLDNRLKIFEMYTILTDVDYNRDFIVSPDELLTWLVQNEKNMCHSYQPIISHMLDKD